MPVKIRLTRRGRKKRPYYHIVVADSRAPRDGKFIESVGAYDPTTNPATIKLDFDRALEWIQKGAQPTDTCRAILSYKGVMMKKHLLEGVKKGALTEEQAESKFEAWMKEKEAKIQAQRDKVESARNAEEKERLEAEAKVNQERAEELAKRNAAAAAEEAKAGEAEEAAEETNAGEAAEEAAETEEAPKAEGDAPADEDENTDKADA